MTASRREAFRAGDSGPRRAGVADPGPPGPARRSGPGVARTCGTTGFARTAVVADDARGRSRRLAGLLAWRGRFDPALAGPDHGLRTLVPERGRYDVRPLVRGLLDHREFVEVRPDHAPNLVAGLGGLTGATIGVVANNPLHDDGRLDEPGAEKAARFVRLCEAFGVPILVVVDVPDHLPGEGWDAAVRAGETLVDAFAGTTVPSATLVTRKALGDARVAMNSRSLGAAAAVYAWPAAQIGEIDIPHRGVPDRIPAGLRWALAVGAVDEVVEPSDTRRRLAESLASRTPRTSTAVRGKR